MFGKYSYTIEKNCEGLVYVYFENKETQRSFRIYITGDDLVYLHSLVEQFIFYRGNKSINSEE